MAGDRDDDAPATFASPPCFMHEVDPHYSGLEAAMDADRHRDVMRWRKATRERLIAERLAIPADERSAFAGRIAERLDEIVGEPMGRTISLYWPFRGEPDLRDWMERMAERGGRCALPVVVAKDRPLEFRCWRRGEALEKGVWNIPVPAAGEPAMPDVVVAPIVGFDPLCYRLGYGGGFFDRTLAAMTKKPLVIGVGYEAAALATIYPLPHDIPMHAVATETAVHHPVAEGDSGT